MSMKCACAFAAHFAPWLGLARASKPLASLAAASAGGSLWFLREIAREECGITATCREYAESHADFAGSLRRKTPRRAIYSAHIEALENALPSGIAFLHARSRGIV